MKTLSIIDVSLTVFNYYPLDAHIWFITVNLLRLPPWTRVAREAELKTVRIFAHFVGDFLQGAKVLSHRPTPSLLSLRATSAAREKVFRVRSECGFFPPPSAKMRSAFFARAARGDALASLTANYATSQTHGFNLF